MSQRLIAILLKQTQQMMQARQPVSDEALLHQFATERDETAFAGLVQRHGPMVWAVCRNSLRCESDAEDAFQATFLALVRKAHRIQSRFTIGAWLHGVAVRVCLKVRESTTRRTRREARAALLAPPIMNDGVWYDELARVHELIRRLPKREHEVFVLCALEGLPQSEVAKRYGLKLTSVSGILARARKRLQIQLRSDSSRSLLALTVAVCSPAMVPAALVSQTCSLARSTVGLSSSVLTLASSVMEVPMRKLLILTVCGLIITSGMTIRTFLLAPAEAQEKPGQAQNANGGEQPLVSYFGQSMPKPNQAGTATTTAITTGGHKWEYKTLRCSVDSLEVQANGLGNEGWELCSTSPGSESSHVICIFKRPKVMKQTSSGTTLNGDPALRQYYEGFVTQTSASAQTASPGYLVFTLKKASASDVAEVLKSSLKNVVTVIDSRSNALHVQCPNNDANAIKLLVETLDNSVKQDAQSRPPVKR
jgi:RNA polymerase sigma factor (sigma-70 family)